MTEHKHELAAGYYGGVVCCASHGCGLDLDEDETATAFQALLAALKALTTATTDMLGDGYETEDGYYVYGSNIREVNDALHDARAAVAQVKGEG